MRPPSAVSATWFVFVDRTLNILKLSHSELGQYDCGQEEEITAVHTLLVPFDEDKLPCFAVGSCRYKAGEKEPTEGQLLIFWVHSDGSSAKLAPAASTPLNGCTYAFTDINGMIAVAVGSSVCPSPM
jgi:DNA damage-binding protein 1